MDLQLDGKICLVTGASAGIGRGIAAVLAAEGAQLAIVARRKHLLDELASELAGRGNRRPQVIAVDVTAPEAPALIAKAVREAFGRIDVLVNNAGGSRPVKPDAPDAVWDEAMALNFTSQRRLTQAVLPAMMAQRWGRIINISGSKELRSVNAAAAAKGALEIWTKGLACDLAPHGITVNVVAPGRIISEQILTKLMPTEDIRRSYIEANIPAGYLGEPVDMGYLVTFLASPLARYITGSFMRVDGGMARAAH